MYQVTLTLTPKAIVSAVASFATVANVDILNSSPPLKPIFRFAYGGLELFVTNRLLNGGVLPISRAPPLKIDTKGSDVPAFPAAEI